MNKPVVLDTNIFISSVFWEGESYDIVKKVIDQDIICFISKDIIKEIKKVLKRDFNLEKQEIEDIADSLALFTHLTKIKEKVDVIEEDPDDNIILECALACNGLFIVTQDNHLLKLKKFKDILILTPKEFLKLC